MAELETSLQYDLLGASERGEFHVEYQPIVATSDGRITGVEALIRWLHPVRGLVAPATLVPLAEQTGLITEIGQWILQQAWTDHHAQDQHGGHGLTMSVNISTHQLMAGGFADTVAAVLERGAIDAGLLSLELTESVFLRDSERAQIVLGDLKDLGVTIALDDFGTGYSSLSYLNRFPIDIVKIDRTFVAGLGRDANSNTMVDAVVHLAHGLRMTVVAEGVETAQQHHELTGLGCDSCQGYYFARPMTAANLDTLIQSRSDGANTRLPVPTT